MKMIFVLMMMAVAALASVEVYYPSTTNLGSQRALICGTGLTCAKSAGKMNVTTVGGLQNSVQATATTITAAQCGSTFYNAGAVTINLPAASASLVGCRLTFVTMNASNFVVDPTGTDQILVLTNAAGDSIVNATLGNSITLQMVSATQWAQISAIGTYTDNN